MQQPARESSRGEPFDPSANSGERAKQIDNGRSISVKLTLIGRFDQLSLVRNLTPGTGRFEM
jgi:hypothetical protein